MAVVSNPPALPVHRCAHCGDEFTTAHPSRRFCSVRCGREHQASVETYRAAQSLNTPAAARSYSILLIDANMQQLAGKLLPRTTPNDLTE